MSSNPFAALEGKRRQPRAAENSNRDTMEAFQHEHPLDEHGVTDVIQHWAAKRSEPRWKKLARMALEYLSIPAMSAEPEYVFSAAKLTITERGRTLIDEPISAVEGLKSWSRDGFIQTSQPYKPVQKSCSAAASKP
jgi:hypothetical protein